MNSFRINGLKYLTLTLMLSVPLMATGPRISTNVFQDNKNDIYALDSAPLISSDIQKGGLIIELVEAVYAEINEDVHTNIIPLQSMMKFYMTQSSTIALIGEELEFDLVKNASYTKIPLYVIEEVYVYNKLHHKDGIKYDGNIAQLKGLVYGTSNNDDIKRFNENSITVKKGSQLSLMKKLRQGDIDLMKTSLEGLEWYTNNKFSSDKENFKVIDKSKSYSVVSIYLNEKGAANKALSDRFQKAFKKMVDDGRYRAILQRYLKDSKKADIKSTLLKQYRK